MTEHEGNLIFKRMVNAWNLLKKDNKIPLNEHVATYLPKIPSIQTESTSKVENMRENKPFPSWPHKTPNGAPLDVNETLEQAIRKGKGASVPALLTI